MNTRQHPSFDTIVRTLHEIGVEPDECSACLEKAKALLALLLRNVQTGEPVSATLEKDANVVREQLIALSQKLKRRAENG